MPPYSPCLTSHSSFTNVSLTFKQLPMLNYPSTAENGGENEVLCLGSSGNPSLFPVSALFCCVLYICQHNAPPTTPLACAFTSFWPQVAPSSFITTQLCQNITFHGMNFGFFPSTFFACSLYPAEAMALFVANADSDIIQLLGCWCIDKMIWYCCLMAEPITKFFTCHMLHGDYHFNPSQLIPHWCLPALQLFPLAPFSLGFMVVEVHCHSGQLGLWRQGVTWSNYVLVTVPYIFHSSSTFSALSCTQ